MTTREDADSKELAHRIRRLLSLIRSITVQMQFEGRDSAESARHLAGRVGALARAALTPISAGMDLESLVLDELRVHRLHRAGILVAGPAIRLNAKSGEIMCLAIHELAANSVKFGALSQPQSQLRVLWWFTGLADSRLHLEWGESEVRMPPGGRKNPGFSSQVVERMIASELHGNGKMLFLSEGVLCTIEVPVGESLLQYE